MKNKKLLRLLIGLISITVCACLMFTACRSDEKKDDEKKPTVAEPTQPDVSQPEETKPLETEPTEPVETEPTVTEPAETEPVETEPEETQPSGGSSGPAVNTGTGGGYNPGTSDPTEPESPTEPEIVVPAAGSEKNAYSEYFREPSATFSTVSIPAGQQMFYRIKTAGSFLRIADADAAVLYNGNTYLPVDGVIEIDLPADDSQVMNVVFENKNAQDKAFSVEIMDAPGTLTNPILLDSIADIQVSLDEGDADGVYYRWIADRSGVLNILLTDAENNAEIAVTVNDQATLSVKEGDEVILQVINGENEEGIRPAAQIQIKGYVAEVVELTVSRIPAELETVTIPSGQSAIYRIRGIWGRTLKIADSDFRVVFDDTAYTADENGEIIVDLPAGSGVVELELFNDAATEKSTVMNVNFYLGHELNPHSLTELGELETVIPENQNGYYYTYQAPHTGLLSFMVWTYPEAEGLKVDIQIDNKTSGDYAALLDDAGNPVADEAAMMLVNAGDELKIKVSVTNITGANVASSLVVYGVLYGSEEQPIFVAYPGFTAHVPAGETLYYSGYNMDSMILTANGENLQIAHNGETYTSVDGVITFNVVGSGRDPAVFAITNIGEEAASFEISFTYPVGHAENPDSLKLGENVLTQTAGAADYYYTFTAPRAGTLTLTFDSAAQWVYAVDNMTQGIYGDTQWSDSDPLMTESTISVNAKDVIRVRVNTYDTANMFETPAGTVDFTVTYITGPTEITGFYMPTTASLMAGEYGLFTGNFYGYTLRVTGEKNGMVVFNGVTYKADSTGTIKLDMPASGTEPLSLMVYNGADKVVTYSLLFSTNDVGTVDNPEKLTLGSHSMVQSIVGGPDHYYQFIAEKSGRLTITFETDVDAIFIVNNNQVYYTHMGKNQVTINVRPGAKINLVVNTYDPSDPMVSPEGTVDFKVELK